jgi:hypothetical protein
MQLADRPSRGPMNRNGVIPKIVEDVAPENLQTIAIESLAAEFHIPIDAVRRTYDEQLTRLKSDARVHHFVTVLAMRNTRRTLRHSRH